MLIVSEEILLLIILIVVCNEAVKDPVANGDTEAQVLDLGDEFGVDDSFKCRAVINE